MPIHAIALLHVPPAQLTAAPGVRIDALEDGALVHTGEDFGREPTELSLALHALLGDALAQHEDARGILMIPEVAAPQARSYAQVVEEVGEGGVWAPLVDDLDQDGEGADFGALLGNLLNQMPSSLLSAASAAASGKPGAFEDMGKQLTQLMGQSSELSNLASQFAGMLGQPAPDPRAAALDVSALDEQKLAAEMANMAKLLEGSGLDLSSPALQELAAKVEAEMQRGGSAEGESESAPEPKKRG